MKIEFTDEGWKETITKHITIRKWGGVLMSLDAWVETNERLFPSVKHRHRCDCCRKKWRKIFSLGNVNIVFTNGPNKGVFEAYKIICDLCYENLKARVKIE